MYGWTVGQWIDWTERMIRNREEAWRACKHDSKLNGTILNRSGLKIKTYLIKLFYE